MRFGHNELRGFVTSPEVTGADSTFVQLHSRPVEGECRLGRRNAGLRGVIQERDQARLLGGNMEERFAEGVSMNIPERATREQRFPLAEAESRQESEEEGRKIRRLQLMMSMVMSVIGQDPSLTVEEASELAAGAKRAALAMFPDKELAYDLLYKPRLQRLMRERFRLQ